MERMEKKRSISEISATGSGSQVPVSNASGSFTMTDYDASGLPYDSSYSVKDMIDTIEISLQDLGISKIGISQIGIAGGVASLGNDGKVPSSQLPTLGTAAALDVATSGDASSTQVVKGDDSRLDDVVEGYYNTTDYKFYATLSGSTYSDEITGVISKVYCDKSTNMLYRWTGSAYTIVGGGTQVNSDWDASSGVAEILNKPTLGTASALDVATSGDASTTEVVKGDDSRLTDARNAADVYAWAKAATKPTYIPVEVGAIGISQIGIANGVASLDNTGKVPSSQLPSYVDEIIEGYLNSTDGKFYEDSAYTTEITGETGKIYVTKDTNKTYRWSGSAFVEISASLALGETSSTAFAGDRGKAIEDCVPSGASSSNKFATANDIPTVGDAAAKGVDTSISAASTSTDLPTSQAVASFVEGKGYVTTDTNTTYSLSVGTGADADKIVLTPSSGTADTITVPYASDAGTVNGKTVAENVPSGAVFTDTTYESKTAASGGSDVSLVTTGEKYTWNNKSDFSGAYADLSGKPTLGTASALDYTTSVTNGSSDLVTSGAVYTAIENLPEPMVFKGSLGSGGTISTLPVDGSASVGDTYKVITDGTYDSQAAKIGDLFICLTKTSSANTWEYIPSADEPSGTVTSVATGVGLTGGPVTSSGTIKANLRSETALTNDSAAATETAGRVYPVAVDNSGYLAVNVPWTDTQPPTAYTSNPEMDGTASAGTSSDYAKGDHVHPSDTSKANQAELAPEFDATRTSSNPYYVGDVVVYNGELYRFILGHYGAWNASDVVKITVGEQIAAYCTNIIAIPASGWSETATSGYYSQTITTPVYSTTYNPHFSISGASATVLPTDAESAAYRAIQHPNGYIEQVDSTHITVYAKVKPDDTFYVKMAGYGMGLQVEGSDIDPYDSTPAMDGVGSAGVSDDYARGDHVHPSDTSKVNKNGDTMTGALTVQSTITATGEITDGAGNKMSEKFDANSFVLQKFRVTVTASSWSSTATSGYYTYALTLPYPINTYKEFSMGLTGSADGTDPTAAESAAYSLVNYFDASDGTGVTSATLRAKTKPTTTFYIMISGYYMQKNAATSGVALDISTANVLDIEWVGRDAKTATWLNGGYDFDGSAERKLYFIDYEFTIYASSWSSTVNSNGYYTNTRNMPGVITSYSKPDIALTASSGNTLPTATQIAAYNLVNYFYLPDDVSAQAITAYAKTKPTADFDIHVKGVWIRS